MATLIVLPTDLTTADLDKIFADFLGAVDHEKLTGFVTRMAADKKNDEIVYLPPPEGETFAEKSMREFTERIK